MSIDAQGIFFDGCAAFHSGKTGYALYEAADAYNGADFFVFMDGYNAAKEAKSQKKRNYRYVV
jgi:hypothetical protein